VLIRSLVYSLNCCHKITRTSEDLPQSLQEVLVGKDYSKNAIVPIQSRLNVATNSHTPVWSAINSGHRQDTEEAVIILFSITVCFRIWCRGPILLSIPPFVTSHSPRQEIPTCLNHHNIECYHFESCFCLIADHWRSRRILEKHTKTVSATTNCRKTSFSLRKSHVRCLPHEVVISAEIYVVFIPRFKVRSAAVASTTHYDYLAVTANASTWLCNVATPRSLNDVLGCKGGAHWIVWRKKLYCAYRCSTINNANLYPFSLISNYPFCTHLKSWNRRIRQILRKLSKPPKPHGHDPFALCTIYNYHTHKQLDFAYDVHYHLQRCISATPPRLHPFSPFTPFYPCCKVPYHHYTVCPRTLYAMRYSKPNKPQSPVCRIHILHDFSMNKDLLSAS